MKENFSIQRVGIAFNLKKKGVSGDRYEEYDEKRTITALKREIKKLGFEVVLFEQNHNFYKKLLKYKPDFVLNIAEGIGSTRGRESQVPCVLESLGIPYSGSDPLVLGVALDKYFTSLFLKSAGIPVPLMFVVRNKKEADNLEHIFKKKSVFIVKPRWEGSSKGIFLKSVVNDFSNLKKRVLEVVSRYRQPAIVEEFLEKEEVTVGVCGNSRPRVLGMMKIVPRQVQQKFFLYSLEIKRDWQKKVIYEARETISGNLQKRVEEYALMAFKALELRDIARIDFRVGRDNIPKIIDINPLPGLSPYYSDLPILCKSSGISYSELVRVILRESLLRYGLAKK